MADGWDEDEYVELPARERRRYRFRLAGLRLSISLRNRICIGSTRLGAGVVDRPVSPGFSEGS